MADRAPPDRPDRLEVEMAQTEQAETTEVVEHADQQAGQAANLDLPWHEVPGDRPEPPEADVTAINDVPGNQERLESLEGINPTNGVENCSHCAVAAHERLGGDADAVAAGDEAGRLNLGQISERTSGERWSPTTDNPADVTDQLRAAGPGTEGIVYVQQTVDTDKGPQEYSHVINAWVDESGEPVYVDTQPEEQSQGRDLGSVLDKAGYDKPDELSLLITRRGGARP